LAFVVILGTGSLPTIFAEKAIGSILGGAAFSSALPARRQSATPACRCQQSSPSRTRHNRRILRENMGVGEKATQKTAHSAGLGRPHEVAGSRVARGPLPSHALGIPSRRLALPGRSSFENSSLESKPRAIFKARSSSSIFPEENCPISRTSRWRGTVKMLSVLTTEGRGRPSVLPTETSVGSPREVRGGGSSAHQTSALRIGLGRPAALQGRLDLRQLRHEGSLGGGKVSGLDVGDRFSFDVGA